MQAFNELGGLVEQSWRAVNYAEDRFAEIAEDCMLRFGLHERIDVWDAPAWTINQDVLPDQRDLAGAFGDLPITMFNSTRFHIDVYFWLDGTTAIHQHGFCGAFQVVQGSSLHSTYTFHQDERINFRMAIGDVRLGNVELLERGQVRQIPAGSAFIHALFHLDKPSVSVVVRTTSTPLELPQFSYHKPSVALDPFYGEPSLTKKLQAFSMTFRSERPAAADQLAEFLAGCDFHTSLLVLRNLRPLLGPRFLEHHLGIDTGKEPFDRMVEVVEARHGSLASVIRPFFRAIDRERDLVQRRSYVSDPQLRFFLAVLLNLDGRDHILDVVAARHPGTDPIETTVNWISALAETKVAGFAVPNALGMDGFSELDAVILEDLMRGRDIQAIQDGMVNSGDDLVSGVPARIVKLRACQLIAPLLGS